MVKHVTILLFVLLLSPFGFSQEKFKAGLLLGISSSQVSGDNASGFNKAGIMGGGFVNYKINDSYSAQFEISYFPKGSRRAPKPDIGDYRYYWLRLNYVEVPVLLKYVYRQFVFEAGPSVGTLLYSYEENEYGQVPALRPFNRYDVSINAGIYYHISPKFDINWRFINSILPIREHASGATFWFNRGQYNTALNFTLRYQFSAAN